MRRWPGAVLATILLAGTHAAMATTYKVTSEKDEGPGTLRWAIAQNNAHPGDNRIEAATSKPLVIRVKSLLPALKGPVTLDGFQHTGRSPGVILDGRALIDGDNQKSCPGAGGRGFGPNVRSLFGPGLAVADSGDVRITGFELRNFCIGILVLRSHDVRIDHNLVHNISGAGGILVTGDAGDDAGRSTQGLTTNIMVEYNDIHDTGDGAECTRGASNVTYRFNTLRESRKRPDVPYSQGVECAGASNDRISFIGNSITGYSDGLQLNGATNILVAGNSISGTTYAITAAGSGLITGNVISGNRMAIGISDGGRLDIRQNRIFDNGHADILSLAGSAGGTTDPASPNLGGIVFMHRAGGGQGQRTASSAEGVPAAAAVVQAAPPTLVLATSSSWQKGPAVAGTVTGQPNTHYRVEIFASHVLDPAGKGEGEEPIGSLDLTTNSQGSGSFTFSGPINPLGDGSSRAYFTATTTGADNATSAFSEPLLLTNAGGSATD